VSHLPIGLNVGSWVSSPVGSNQKQNMEVYPA